MGDYINYIDYKSIKLGESAAKSGNYTLAIMHYSKALDKLHKYQGDRMQPIMMASDIAKKIEKFRQVKS